MQPIDSNLLKLLIPVAVCHALGHVTSNVSFAAVAVSFTHTVKGKIAFICLILEQKIKIMPARFSTSSSRKFYSILLPEFLLYWFQLLSRSSMLLLPNSYLDNKSPLPCGCLWLPSSLVSSTFFHFRFGINCMRALTYVVRLVYVYRCVGVSCMVDYASIWNWSLLMQEEYLLIYFIRFLFLSWFIIQVYPWHHWLNSLSIGLDLLVLWFPTFHSLTEVYTPRKPWWCSVIPLSFFFYILSCLDFSFLAWWIDD